MRRVKPAVKDVVEDGVVEEDHVLRDLTQNGAQTLHVHLQDSASISSHFKARDCEHVMLTTKSAPGLTSQVHDSLAITIKHLSP